MIHLGDITKLNGYEMPAVDVICGGSPCQDLSVAGNRAGLDGERSGLFMEQIRIVKEMRDATANDNIRLVKPRFMVWENVVGALSSPGKGHTGEDFQAVLTEIVRIIEPNAPDVPMPEKGKWSKSGCLYDELGRWSIAYRVHDAQFWGVPQRRKRIALVADFGGLSAPEICFERKGMSWDYQEGGAQREGVAVSIETSIKAAGFDGNMGSKAGNIGYENEKAPTLNAGKQMHVNVLNDQGGSVMDISEDITATLRAQEHGHQPIVFETDSINTYVTSGAQFDVKGLKNKSHTLRARDYKEPQCIVYGQSSFGQYKNHVETLKACGGDIGGGSENLCVSNIVRRLTPLECERLQGFPDNWTLIGQPEDVEINDYKTVCDEDGNVIEKTLIGTHTETEFFYLDENGKKKKCSDSARYKALGNSIALPFWQWLARRICAQYERDITMGSLFDGIGGFPLVFERCGAKAVWASEIEEFPIAVTKYHFPEA